MTSSAGCKRRRNAWTALRVSALLALFLWSVGGLSDDLARIVPGLPFICDYLRGMVPPDWSVLPEIREPWIETLRMAVVSITLSSLASLPLSFLAARPTTPHALAYALARGAINLLRAMPTLLWAILFVAMVGLGPLAGVFALTVHCIGTLGKYFSEAIEAVMPTVKDVMEAMQMDGANRWQAIYYGLLPELAPLFVGYILYYFEWALRVGTVMGLVGAGGLGLYLTMTVRLFKRRETLAVVLVVLSTVTVVDALSSFVRSRWVEWTPRF